MTDPRLEPVLLAAVGRIQTAAQAAAAQAVEALGLIGMSATGAAQRQAAAAAQFELRTKLSAFVQAFAQALHQRVTADLRKEAASSRGSQTDWQSLSLVDDNEVEALVSADRLGAELAQECEWELRELDGYMGSLLGPHADPDQNPLRPRNVGRALFTSLESVSSDAEVRKVLAREIGRGLGKAMRSCYQGVIDDLRQRGVQPQGMGVRAPSTPRSTGGGLDGPATGAGRDALRTEAGAPGVPQQPSRHAGDAQFARALGAMFGVNVPQAFAHTGASAPGALDMASTAAGLLRGGVGAGGAAGGAPRSPAADAAMMDVIRRLAFVAPGGGTGPGASSPGAAAAGNWAPTMPAGTAGLDTMPMGADGAAVTDAGALGALMAVNLIRAHREELVRATNAPLDHMVIDVVAALFDQVLSDPKVPPQMAREIARLQLPVLRVALKDMAFFSSRKHPVRKLVNRIASLAATFDDFDDGPGKECLVRVSQLVQEIVEGDFDQMALYEAKLGELEGFIQEQTRKVADEHADASSLLGGKEADLRVQQRYMRALQAQLATIELPDFLRDFIAQVWSQVYVLALSREGTDSARVQRIKRASRELAMSIQPKGTPQLRKEFLLRLPQLMKDLNEGLEMIRWPEEAKKEFFAKLLPAHAASLKQPPPTDFSQRQLKFALDQVDKVPVPSREEVAGEVTPLLGGDTEAPVMTLTDEEASKIGLVDDKQIDWTAEVDIDLNEPAAVSTAEVDINLDSPPPPSTGAQLVNHIKPGVAYQMHLNDQWSKVRLSWISPGRTFFIFTYGRMYKQTISLTGRTLVKMCESGRFRAFENAELIERATARARRQLAALGAAAGSGGNTKQ